MKILSVYFGNIILSHIIKILLTVFELHSSVTDGFVFYMKTFFAKLYEITENHFIFF